MADKRYPMQFMLHRASTAQSHITFRVSRSKHVAYKTALHIYFRSRQHKTGPHTLLCQKCIYVHDWHFWRSRLTSRFWVHSLQTSPNTSSRSLRITVGCMSAIRFLRTNCTRGKQNKTNENNINYKHNNNYGAIKENSTRYYALYQNAKIMEFSKHIEEHFVTIFCNACWPSGQNEHQVYCMLRNMYSEWYECKPMIVCSGMGGLEGEMKSIRIGTLCDTMKSETVLND